MTMQTPDESAFEEAILALKKILVIIEDDGDDDPVGANDRIYTVAESTLDKLGKLDYP